jgi:hypothetical protein
MALLHARQVQEVVDDLVQRLGRVDVNRSRCLLIFAIQIEHEFDACLAERPVVVRSP